MKITKKGYLKAWSSDQMNMQWHLFDRLNRKIDLFILLGIVFLAFMKWG